jgi:hypothetical protein
LRSPASAIAWEFRRRHLWAPSALAAYLLALAIIKVFILGRGEPVRLDPPDGRAAVAIVPISVTFMYLLAAFSFGLEGDLAGRPSIYPARMLALPVTTRALAGWPMLYGAATMASLWLVAALFARWPWEIDLPLIWPALLAAAFLAWTQALSWMPYGLPGLRVILAVLWLAALDATVILAIHYKVPEPLMVAGLLPQFPLVYLAACFAVARARCGSVPDWRGDLARVGSITEVRKRGRVDFVSPTQAQMWFEWRLHGRSLPGMVAFVLPFEAALLFIASRTMPEVVIYFLFGVLLLTPPFVAGFTAATTFRASPQGRGSHGLTPFTAARPLTSAALVAARLKVAIWSTLLAWLLVLVTIAAALTFAGRWPVEIERGGEWMEGVGTLRVLAMLSMGFLGLMALTWKQLVQNLYIGLTGRAWVVRTSVLLTLSVLVIVWPAFDWVVRNREAPAGLWDWLPWIAGVLVGLKVSAAVGIAVLLRRRRLLSDRALVAGALCWLVAVSSVYGLLGWLVTTPLVPRYILALAAVLSIPLARPAAAPLALSWNRHR